MYFSPVTSSWCQSGPPPLKKKNKKTVDRQIPTKLMGQKVSLLAHGTDRFKVGLALGTRFEKVLTK